MRHEHNQKFIDAVGGADLTGVVKEADVITQTLTGGDNTVNHNLGVLVNSVTVKDGNELIEVTINDIDTDNVNINLAGGSVTDATILINYKVV